MKNWLKKNILPNVLAICAGFSLFFDVYYISSVSNFLFGEPDFPVED